MPDDERAVCERLRSFREARGIRHADFAKLSGLSPKLLNSYESARSQLNYTAFWRIFNAFPELNPVWLAAGSETMTHVPMVDYPSPEETGFGPRSSFLLVFQSVLKQKIFQARSAWGVGAKDPFPYSRFRATNAGRVAAVASWTEIIKNWITLLPDAKVNEFLNELLHSGGLILKKFPEDSEQIVEARRRLLREMIIQRRMLLARVAEDSGVVLNQDLTNSATSAKDTAMQGKWPALKKQLQAATEKTGKSALAKFIKVDLTRISQWLTDAKSQREPGAEYALQMQDWLRRQT